MANRLAGEPAPKAVHGEHLVRVVVLQDVPDRPDRLLVLVQPAGAIDVV